MRIAALLVFTVFLSFAGGAPGYASEDKAVKPAFHDFLERAARYFGGRSSSQFSHPYLRPAEYSHDNHRDGDWSPEDWVEAEGSATQVIDGFYDAGIIVDQNENNGPILSVGEPFLRLSPLDQYRVATFIDYAFKMSEKEAGGVYQIYHKGQAVGLYSKHGLQMR